jgi:hypothetical protein
MSSPVEFDAVIDVRVFQDDNYCSVTLAGPEWEASGNARRDPEDEPKYEIGFILALGRALENAGRKLQKRGNGLVKHADDVKLAKFISSLKDEPLPTLEELLEWLAEVGVEEVPFERQIFHGFSPGPDFSDPNDPAFNLLGVGADLAEDDDGETIFVRFHFAEPA